MSQEAAEVVIVTGSRPENGNGSIPVSLRVVGGVGFNTSEGLAESISELRARAEAYLASRDDEVPAENYDSNITERLDKSGVREAIKSADHLSKGEVKEAIKAAALAIVGSKFKIIKGSKESKRFSDEKLSKNEEKRLKENGLGAHELKPRKNGSKFDLFKDEDGRIFVKPKDGSGPGDNTGLNINDFL